MHLPETGGVLGITSADHLARSIPRQVVLDAVERSSSRWQRVRCHGWQQARGCRLPSCGASHPTSWPAWRPWAHEGIRHGSSRSAFHQEDQEQCRKSSALYLFTGSAPIETELAARLPFPIARREPVNPLRGKDMLGGTIAWGGRYSKHLVPPAVLAMLAPRTRRFIYWDREARAVRFAREPMEPGYPTPKQHEGYSLYSDGKPSLMLALAPPGWLILSLKAPFAPPLRLLIKTQSRCPTRAGPLS